MFIGEKLKQLRIRTGLTQEELANRCELSKGFISQVERDLTSPSIATLVDILESLGTNLSDFFNETGDTKVVFKRDDVFVQEDEEAGRTIDWIIPNAQKNKMEPILVKLANNGKTEVLDPHEGEVFGYVLQGNLLLNIGNKKHRVKKGESFYYTAMEPYYVENTSGRDAVLLWVSTPPSF